MFILAQYYMISTHYSAVTITIISGTAKARDCKFGRYIHTVRPNPSPWKILEKKSVGVSRDGPTFLSTPYYLRNA